MYVMDGANLTFITPGQGINEHDGIDHIHDNVLRPPTSLNSLLLVDNLFLCSVPSELTPTQRHLYC